MTGYNCHKTMTHNCNSPHYGPQSEVKPLDDAGSLRERVLYLEDSMLLRSQEIVALMDIIDSLKRTNEAQAKAIAAVKALPHYSISRHAPSYVAEDASGDWIRHSDIRAAIKSVERES